MKVMLILSCQNIIYFIMIILLKVILIMNNNNRNKNKVFISIPNLYTEPHYSRYFVM